MSSAANDDKGNAMVEDRTNADEGGEHSHQRPRRRSGVQILEGGNEGHLEREERR